MKVKWKLVAFGLLSFVLLAGCTPNSPASTQTPSLSPTQTTAPSNPSWVPPTPEISQEEAIAIAYRNVPPLVVERAPLSVRWTPQIAPHGAWQMEFEDTGITQEELGWVNDPSGTPEVRLNDIISTRIYKILLINIDGQTGEVTLKMASSANIRTYTLPPPLTVVPPKSPAVYNNYRSDVNHLSVNLPDGWEAAEGPEYIVTTGHLQSIVAFNSWGEEGFWSREEIHGASHIYSLSTVINSLPPGGAYIVLILINGPPAIGSEPEEYLPNSFDDLLTPDNWQIGPGFNSSFSFSKWGKGYQLQVAIDSAATGKTVEELRSVLASWRFDAVPAGDAEWMGIQARRILPEEVEPLMFSNRAGSRSKDDRSWITAVETSEDNLIFRFTYQWDNSSHWWDVDVSPDGKVVLTGEGGDTLPF